MLSISDYLHNCAQSVIDCHVHLFGADGQLDYNLKVDNMITMVENNVSPKHVNDPLLPYFDKFLKNGINGKYLLCVGTDVEETIAIYKKYTNYFCGFGEVKCIKHFKDTGGTEHTYKEMDILRTVMLLGANMPVFIHWDLMDDDSYKLLDEELTRNPKTKVVLCHCGINELDDQQEAFDRAIKLQGKHPNLWLEISWVALDFFENNPSNLYKFENPDRVIVGTDVSRALNDVPTTPEDRYKKFIKIYRKFNTEQSLHNLFS